MVIDGSKGLRGAVTKVCIINIRPLLKSRTYAPFTPRPTNASPCASSKLLRPRNQGLTLRLNSGPKTAKLRRYARRCCLPRLTWRPCHSGDVSAPRRPGVGERRFAAASDGAEERAPTPTARRHGTGFLGCSSRFVGPCGRAACSSSTRTPWPVGIATDSDGTGQRSRSAAIPVA